jgi:protoporphyrinogen oxidase
MEQKEKTGAPSVDPVVVIGAGPAGLTAAYQLTKTRNPVVVLEADDVVGGISRSVERDGWRFDIGGHRFFTKVRPVEDLWHEILPDGEFLTRPRMSRIYYGGQFYDYPIRPMNALKNLGVAEAARCVGSYLSTRLRPPRQNASLEDYIVANYGRRLYSHFFKTYNEKVWGVSASEISADWGAQRIKGMSLFSAVWEPVRSRLPGGRRHPSKQVTSLIEEFQYPKLGPGMMWERCHELVTRGGGDVRFNSRVVEIELGPGGAKTVVYECGGRKTRIPASHVISSMPFSDLARVMRPSAPFDVRRAADDLHYRDFLTVALIVPAEAGFPDNWIYIHDPEVKVGRVQNFASWSPFLVKDGRTCLGLEYWVTEGDEMWQMSDDDLVAMASKELEAIGLASASMVERGYVVRMPKAYPVYDEGYRAAVEVIRRWMASEVPNVHPVGRNGMHKYNNQDHSMYTAMLTVQNITAGTRHDVWSVNVDDEYQEELATGRATGEGALERASAGEDVSDPSSGGAGPGGQADDTASDTSDDRRSVWSSGTGREAPLIRRRVSAASSSERLVGS